MRIRRVSWAAGAVAAAGALSIGVATPASADGAVVERLGPGACGWTAGSFPGVDEDILATSCQLVSTPSGGVRAVLRGQLPEQYRFDRAFIDRTDPCIVVVSVSGQINSTCRF